MLRENSFLFFFQAEDGIRDYKVTGVQTCALPISDRRFLELRRFACGESPAFDRTKHRDSSVRIGGGVAMTVTTRAVALLILILSAAPAEPIRLHPKNPHYFLYRGKAVALITSGEHYGAVMNADFDYH